MCALLFCLTNGSMTCDWSLGFACCAFELEEFTLAFIQIECMSEGGEVWRSVDYGDYGARVVVGLWVVKFGGAHLDYGWRSFGGAHVGV